MKLRSGCEDCILNTSCDPYSMSDLGDSKCYSNEFFDIVDMDSFIGRKWNIADRRFAETILTHNFDFYADGDWSWEDKQTFKRYMKNKNREDYD